MPLHQDLLTFGRDPRGFTGAERALMVCFALAVIVLTGVLVRSGSEKAAGDAARVLRSGAGSLGDVQGAGPLSGSQLPQAAGDVPPAGGAIPVPTGAPRSTEQILRDYQVRDDEMTDWEPWGPAGWFTDPIRVTRTEAELLDSLQWRRGLLGLNDFKGIKEQAYSASDDRFDGPGGEDGHQDAFRHIYWNALLSRKFGEEFATAFATAHEGVPGNPADREAMDLYNNELGRRIARENPDASDAELQEIIMREIQSGHALVIDRNGELVFSDQVAVGHTGTADDAPVNGTQVPPEWSGSR
jgi:hypothetical protein